MADSGSIQGELQAQVMAAVWRLSAGTVEQVRGELPPRYVVVAAEFARAIGRFLPLP